MLHLRTFFFILVFLPGLLLAAKSPKFQQGKDYQLITSHVEALQTQKNKVLVVEFFSYGCPWCFRLEPHVEAWQKNKASYIQFKRIPVVFEPGWDIYARAYYISEALGIENKMTPALFDAVQKKRMRFQNATQLSQFFVEHGVDQRTAEMAFLPSPAIDAKVKQGKSLFSAYKLYAVPSFAIAGKYKTDLQMAQGDYKKLFAIINYLAKKSKEKA